MDELDVLLGIIIFIAGLAASIVCFFFIVNFIRSKISIKDKVEFKKSIVSQKEEIQAADVKTNYGKVYDNDTFQLNNPSDKSDFKIIIDLVDPSEKLADPSEKLVNLSETVADPLQKTAMSQKKSLVSEKESYQAKIFQNPYEWNHENFYQCLKQYSKDMLFVFHNPDYQSIKILIKNFSGKNISGKSFKTDFYILGLYYGHEGENINYSRLEQLLLGKNADESNPSTTKDATLINTLLYSGKLKIDYSANTKFEVLANDKLVKVCFDISKKTLLTKTFFAFIEQWLKNYGYEAKWQEFRFPRILW